MGLQRVTCSVIDKSVDRKENFSRGNVSGKWVSKGYYPSTTIGMLPTAFAKVLVEHSKNAELFVLYSYATPMAWYSLERSEFDTENIGTDGTGKWYYVDHRYSASTTNHQNAYRMALKGKNVVTLTFGHHETGSGEISVIETEKEYY